MRISHLVYISLLSAYSLLSSWLFTLVPQQTSPRASNPSHRACPSLPSCSIVQDNLCVSDSRYPSCFVLTPLDALLPSVLNISSSSVADSTSCQQRQRPTFTLLPLLLHGNSCPNAVVIREVTISHLWHSVR